MLLGDIMATENTTNHVVNVTDNGSTDRLIRNIETLLTRVEAVQNAANRINLGGSTQSGSTPRNPAPGSPTPGGSQPTQGGTAGSRSVANSVMSGSAYGTLRATGSGTGAASRDFAKESQGLGGLVRLYATYAANVFAVSAAFGALSRAMDTTNMVSSMNQLGASVGKSLGSVSKNIVELTGGAISLSESMQAVAKTSAAGIANKDIERLAVVAKNASLSLGISMPDALSRLSRGVTKLEPELLDELGLFTKIGPATETYARSVGKSVSALTDFEKRQAFTNAVLKEGEDKFSALGDAVDVNPYDKLIASLQNLAQTGLSLVNTVLGPIIKLLSESPMALATAVGAVGLALVKQALPALGQFKEGLTNQANAARDIAISKAKEARAAQQQIAALATKDLAAQSDAATAALDRQQKEIDKLRKQGQFNPAGATAQALAQNTPTVSGRTLGKMEQERRDYLKEGNVLAAQAVQLTMDQFKASKVALDGVKAVNDAEKERAKQREASNDNYGRTIKAADKAQQESAKSAILANAAINQSLIGNIGAWQLFQDQIEKSGLKLTAFEKAMLNTRGAAAIAGSAIAGYAAIISGALNVIGLIVAVFSILDVAFSKNAKEMSKFSSAIDAAKESIANTTRTLALLYNTAAGDANSIKGINAIANAFREVARSAEEAIISAKVAKQTLGGIEVPKEWLKGLYGGDIDTTLAKTLASQIMSSLKLLDAAGIGEQARTEFQQVLGLEKITFEGVKNKILQLGVDGLDPTIKLTNKFGLALSNLDSRLEKFSTNLDTTNKAYKDYLLSISNQDPLFKLGENINNTYLSMLDLKENGVQGLVAAMKNLAAAPEKVAFFGPEFTDQFIALQQNFIDASKALNTYESALESLRQGKAKFEKENLTGVGFDFTDRSEQVKKSILNNKDTSGKLAAQYAAFAPAEEELKKRIEITTNDESFKKAQDLFSFGMNEAFKKGSELIQTALNNGAELNAIKLAKASAQFMTGEEKARTETKLNQQELDIRIKTIKTNIDLMLNQDRLTAAIEENSAAIAHDTAVREGKDAKLIQDLKDRRDAAGVFKQILGSEIQSGTAPDVKGQAQRYINTGEMSDRAKLYLQSKIIPAEGRYASLTQAQRDEETKKKEEAKRGAGAVIQGKAEDVTKKLAAEASVKQALKDQLALRQSIIGIADKNLIITENTKQEEILLKNQAKELEQAEAAVKTAKLSGGPQSIKNAEDLLKLTKERQGIEIDTQALQAKQRLLQVELDIISKTYDINKANLEIDMARSQIAYTSNIARLNAYGKLSGVSEELLANETARLELARADQESVEKLRGLEEDRLKKVKELEKRKDIAGDPNGVIQAEIEHTNTLSAKAKERIKIETDGKKDILNLNKEIALIEAEIAKRAREFELQQSKAQTKYAQESLALEKRRMSISAVGEIGGPDTTFAAGMAGKYLEDQQRIAEFNESNRKITDATNQETLAANTRVNGLIQEQERLQSRLNELGNSKKDLTTAETLELVQGAQQLRDNKKLQEDIATELARRVNLSEEESKRLVAQNEQRKYQIELDGIRLKLAEDIRQINLQAALETSKREIKNSEKLGELELQRSKIDVYAQNNPSAESYLALIRSINEEESARLQTQIQINNIATQSASAIAVADAQKAANARLVEQNKLSKQGQTEADALITAGLQKQLEINTNAVLNAQTQLEFKLKTLEVTKEQNLQQAKYNELLGVTNNLATSLKDTFTMFGDTFKKIGEGLGAAVTSLVESSIRQEKFVKQQAADEEKLQNLRKKGIDLQNTDEYGEDIIKNKKEQVALEKKMANDKYRNTRAEITENQQAASSIKNLFKEKTAAYKAFAILEKALAIQKLLLDAQKLASEFGLTAATLTSTGTRISATVAEAEVNSVAGVIKAIASLPFPLNLAAGAATAAAMASLMNKIGGNGPGFTGGSVNTGTGTTFGDATKPSETLKQSQEALSNTDPILMRNSSQMLKHLRSIDYNIANLGVALVRNLGGGDIAGGQLGIQAGTTATGGNIGRIAGAAGLGAAAGFGTSALMSSIGFGAAGGMLGGAASSALLDFVIPGLGTLLGAVIGSKAFKTSVGIQGQGIQSGPQSLADIRSQGFQGQTYADVETKKRAFGIAYSTRQSTVTGALDADISRTFTQIFSNAGDALISASSVLDKDLNQITNKVDSFVVNLGKLNLQGLKTEEQQKLFENVVGAELDRLVTEVYPEIVDFIKVGEGAGTTLARMTYGIESANTALEILGIQAIKYTDILNKQGDVGGEIARQSILAVETQGLIKRVIENADGSAQDIIDLYTKLDTLRDKLVDLGISQDFLTEKVLIAAGGTDKFSDSLEKFYDKFTSEEFKTALETDKATAVFTKLGIAIPKTREAFYTLFQTLTANAPESAAALLKVIDSIDTLYKSVDKATSERKDLQRKLDELLLSSTQLRELDILNLDESNRALQRQIWAQQDMQTAAKALQSRLSDVTKTITQQITSLTDYRQSLLVGDKSTLTSIEQYQQAKQNLSDLYRAATDKTATDEVRNTALGKLQGASEQVLGLSRQLYASGAQYNTDQATVIGILDATKGDLEKRKTDAQLQLDQLEGSNSYLTKIQANTKSTSDYIAEFLAAQSVYNVAASQPGAGRASFAVGTNYVPQDMTADIHRGERIIPAADNITLMASNQEMVKEIKQLNQRIVNLEQAIVEGNMINAAATDRNTDAIVVAIESGTDTTIQFNRLQKKGTLK